MKLFEKIAITVFFAVWALLESAYLLVKSGESFENNKIWRAINEWLLALLTPSVIAGTAMYFCWDVIKTF